MKKNKSLTLEQIEGLKQEQMISAAPLMYKTLEYLNDCGGLGFEKHRLIDEALDAATFKQ